MASTGLDRRARASSRMRACLVAFLAVVAPCGRPIASPAPVDVRVLVYNIHAGKDAAGVDNLTRVADVVRAARADVVLLQEVDRRTRRSGQIDQPDLLARQTGFSVAFGKTLDYDGGEYGIAILSRWPITEQALIRLAVDPPQRRSGGSYEPRGAQRVVVRTLAGRLAVLNTHLDASREDHYRQQEARGVLAAVRAVDPSVLVGGDFNATPESDVQAAIRQAGLRDVWLECGRGDGFTYPADAPAKRIDYLFLTGTMSCTRAEVLATSASDHRPLLVTVRLR
jgi:endonuclease/exonuclease/phosphatase family metal-dependent hydrolase